MNLDSEIVLILSPTENDASVAAQVLRESGLLAMPCRNMEFLCDSINTGCAVIVIAEEALPIDELPRLQNILINQEAWSDIPVILLTGQGPVRSWESFSASGNISILERPFSRLTMIRAVEVGLRARRKQYQVRHLINEQQRATQKRDEFFATLSHELRTPLIVILGWTELLRSNGLNESEKKEALLVLERNARLQKALIDDLLDTSRIITGKLHFEATAISLRETLISAQQGLLLRAEQKKIKTELVTPTDDCIIYADEQRMAQVISNLLTNAIKFTPEGGWIKITLTKNLNNYSVSIKDSGQGIDPEFLPFVFDRLKQEDMSTTRSHGGLGLGLAIVAHIVEQHNGVIEARSAGRGQGSEFILSLPALPTEIRKFLPPEEKIVSNLNSLKGIRVLVVDDSPDILELISIWLRKAQAEVKLVGSAAEALKELPTYNPDILLSDIGMPEMDGYQLIKQVRNFTNEKIKNVKAVALTAYAKDEERTMALKAGFQIHISKPISNEQLVSAIFQLVRPN